MRGVFCEKRDKLFVEAENLYHFRGKILCNAKRLQFNGKKNKNARPLIGAKNAHSIANIPQTQDLAFAG